MTTEPMTPERFHREETLHNWRRGPSWATDEADGVAWLIVSIANIKRVLAAVGIRTK